ncbi:Carcinoembryonic antigen-related cell adhesion molecule 20 [Merluccius polli]|uniref:Carcinoembryonic antigen-related cell adhesion molecule 20 n=1 Tax=Merluccius polli TaxID=89951 RepID=A0AA47M2Z6_MERPO|nr:Carcinoembryonic antigen-related cell adhesion molecule 20 [Merluccius polli]
MVLHVNLSSCLVLVRFCLSQRPVSIEFQTDPVLVQTDTDIVFTVVTVPDVVLVQWNYPGGSTLLAFWSPTGVVVNAVPQYLGRVSLTRTQLRISSAQLDDAGSYTVTVNPSSTSEFGSNSRSVDLRVFVGVSGVSLAVPPVAVEGSNISLTCSWTAGTEVAVAWGFQGAAITAGGRISISGGSLVIDPGRRGDAGEYSCTASNPVSARSATQSLTVYYGPDTPVLTKDRPVQCVGGGDAVLGQTVTLTCQSESLPPALFSWQHNGRPVATVQPDSGVLGVQVVSANQSGRYTCQAQNAITGGVSEQSTEVVVVQTCLSGGAVAGIVIGSLAVLLVIILLIVLLVLRGRRDASPLGNVDVVPSTDPPFHQPNHHYNHLQQYSHHQPNNATLPGDRDPNRTSPNGNHHDNARLLPTTTTTLPQRTLPDGIDNSGFSHAVEANALSHPASHNANILIQGAAPEGTQPATVQVNLGPQPGVAAATLPALHVNLNSFPPSAHPLPMQNLPGTETSHTHPVDSGRPNDDPRMQRSDPASRVFGREPTGDRPLVPTGYSHRSSSRANTHTDINASQRHTNTHPSHRHTNSNTDTRTDQRHTDTHADRRDRGPSSRSGDVGRASTRSRGHAPTPSQNPWDLLRGTPAYPNAPQGDSTSDYTTQNPLQPQTRASEPRRVDTEGRRRQEVMSDARLAWVRPSPSPSRHSHDAPHSQRERTRSHTPRQIALEPRGHVTQQRPITTQSLDTRALADPNHLAQTQPSQHLAQTQPSLHLPQTQPSQHLAQTQPSLHLPQTQPSQHLPQMLVAPPTTRQHQGNPSSKSNGIPLTQEALQTHTQRSQTFQNRNQQTQAALLRPPTPPQVLPLAEFQALPRERIHDRSPRRPAPRPTANLPACQRLHVHAHMHPHHPRNTGHAPHAHHGHHANGHHGHNGNPHQVSIT